MNPLTREELFLNCLINGIEPPEPKTREEELFVKLIEKINKPFYTTLYQFSDDGDLYLKNNKSYKAIESDNEIKELLRNSPLYFKKYNNSILVDEGIVDNRILVNYNSPDTNSNQIFFTRLQTSQQLYYKFNLQSLED